MSLSDDIDFAKMVVAETQKAGSRGVVVLEIDTQYLTPSLVENYLRAEDPEEENPFERAEIHEVHYGSIIPPEAITVLSDK